MGRPVNKHITFLSSSNRQASNSALSAFFLIKKSSEMNPVTWFKINKNINHTRGTYGGGQLCSLSLMFLIKLMRRKERFAVHARATSIKCPGPGPRWPRGRPRPEHEVSFRLFFSLSFSPPPPSSSLLSCLWISFIMNIIGGCPERALFHPRLWSSFAGCAVKPVHVRAYKGSSCTSVSFVRAGDTVVFHQQEKVSPI